jgi:hypothetical protein
MDDSELQKEFRDLRARVDFLAESFMALQAVLVVHLTNPEAFELFDPKELMKVLEDKQKSAHQKMEILTAMRERKQPPQNPPHLSN